MLSLFPDILFLAPFSAFLLRLSLGVVFGYAAWKYFAHETTLLRAFGFVEAIIAIALIAGAWTQAAALAAFIVIAIHFFMPSLRTIALGTALLSLVISISLLVTGAGVFALDLPL